MAKKKEENGFIKHIKTEIPNDMEYSVNFRNEKDKVKFIKRTERIIRASLEYRDYIAFLKEHVNMNRCAFFQNVCSSEGKKIKIEIHHEPFTLYDYVEVVVNKFVDEGRDLNDLLIADEVMKLHYDNLVGLIPLSKTIHQMVHNSTKVTIPLNMVYGNYAEFLKSEEYGPYTDALLDKLEEKIEKTKNLSEKDFENLKKQFTYLDIKDAKPVEKQEVKTKNVEAA